METLVLDVGYQPIARVSWRRTMRWLVKEIIHVVDEYPEYANSETWKVRVPSVVRLTRVVARRKAIKFSRHNIYARDKGKCQYCGSRVARADFTYEHVVPRAQGGKTCWENIVVSCVSCNQVKGDRTPAQAGMRLLSVPVRPKSLPNTHGFMPRYDDTMPKSWEQWLRHAQYWDGALEES